jgi:hypothetical protein
MATSAENAREEELDVLGTSAALSFRPVSTALADQPATTRREPITATVHAAHESMIQAHTTSVTRARRLPGSSG